MGDFLDVDFEKKIKNIGIKSFSTIYLIDKRSTVKYWLLGLILLASVILFLPWTQNIRAKGKVTTRRQEDRPQELNTVIPGKVLKWYVKEGDFVQKGDTILQLGEVKAEYLDPILLQRTQQQIAAKNKSIEAYLGKVGATDSQVIALESGKNFKLLSVDNKIGQQRLKISSDSVDVAAAKNALDTYKRQISGARAMLDSGVISLIEFEKRSVIYQDGVAKLNSAINKFNQSKQEFLNLRIEKNAILQEYNDKIAKASGERFSSFSDAASTEAEVAKLENAFSNYDARRQLYFITAPQSGQITKAKKAGLGEILKEGEMIVEIVPVNSTFAVEMFVNPMDLPLVARGENVRFVFDGFPAIVFSGWPSTSYGTFGGVISAVETSISSNGMFRILVIEDEKDKKWPTSLRIGGGANGIALLEDVPIWYELWRNINGFPPEYYIAKTNGIKNGK
jgi:multidrug efflux pump subunit AcrA (membrane-fusion protein)